MGGVGHHDGIVLILAEKVEAFAIEHAANDKRDVADANGLTERVGIREKLFYDGRTDDADLGGGAQILIAKHGAGVGIPGAHAQVFGADATHLGAPVETIGEHLVAVAYLGGNGNDVGDVAAYGLHVVDRQSGSGSKPATGAAGGKATGENSDDIAAERRDLAFHLHFGAVANGDGGDHSGHAYDNAKGGECGTEFVPAQGAQGNNRGSKEAHVLKTSKNQRPNPTSESGVAGRVGWSGFGICNLGIGDFAALTPLARWWSIWRRPRQNGVWPIARRRSYDFARVRRAPPSHRARPGCVCSNWRRRVHG